MKHSKVAGKVAWVWSLRLSCLAALLLLSVTPTVWHGAYAAEPPKNQYAGYPGFGGDFALRSDRGPEQLSQLPGEWRLLVFGFSECPAVCPMILSKMNKVAQQLQAQAQPLSLQGVFVSVDAKNDGTAQGLVRLTEYVQTFNPHFVGLSGSAQEIKQVTQQYGIYYEGEGTEMMHTDRLFLLSQEGAVYQIFGREQTVDEMVKMIQQITAVLG